MRPPISFLLSLLLFSILTSCSDDAPAPEDSTFHHENSNLDVFVEIETDTGFVPAIGALIYLYTSEQDRTDNYDEEVKGETNAMGKHSFTGLSRPEYWITVTLPLDGRVKPVHENAPYGTPGHPVLSNTLNVRFEK